MSKFNMDDAVKEQRSFKFSLFDPELKQASEVSNGGPIVKAPSELLGPIEEESAFDQGFQYMEANAEAQVIQETVEQRNRQLKKMISEKQ